MERPTTVVLVEGPHRAVLEAARIDASGAFVRSDLLLERGEQIGFEVELPDGRSVRGTARVKGVLARGAVRGMMLEFIGLDPRDAAALASATGEE